MAVITKFTTLVTKMPHIDIPTIRYWAYITCHKIFMPIYVLYLI